MSIQIREEGACDTAKIYRAIGQVFSNAPHIDHAAQFVGEALRNLQALTISQVVEAEEGIVGHIAVSPIAISNGATGWFGLVPISVSPDFRDRLWVKS